MVIRALQAIAVSRVILNILGSQVSKVSGP